MSEVSRIGAPQGLLAPSGKSLSRQDTVPRLREDLMVSPGEVPGQFEVRDPRGGGALVLYDVELSVARMLDGRRRVAEVLENADRLGIPADVDGLSRFIRSLERHRFLAPPGSPRDGEGRRHPPRKAWDDRTRARFQAGMKLMRTGRRDEAVPVFQQLLDADPGQVEAGEMLSLIAAGHKLAAHPIGELFSSRDLPGSPGGRTGWTWTLLVVAVLAAGGLVGWRALRLGAVAGQPPASASASASASPEQVAPRTAPVERRWHPAVGELRAPAAGVLAWREPPPARVARGERLGAVRAVATTSTPSQASRARLEELERLAASDAVYQEFLEKERATLAGKAAGGHGVDLASPLAGTLTLVARSGARVEPGELVARVVDGEAWRLSATWRGAPPRPGTECEVSGDGASDRAPGQVLEVTARDGQHEVTCALTAAQAPWLELARAPYLTLQ
jgi:hypothetical protein